MFFTVSNTKQLLWSCLYRVATNKIFSDIYYTNDICLNEDGNVPLTVLITFDIP